jgi:putative addiction module component (TIGR02574 family)
LFSDSCISKIGKLQRKPVDGDVVIRLLENLVNLTSMEKRFELNDLSIPEKIQLMEVLWNDLISSSGYELSEWHTEELRRRQNAVAEDKESYLDWNEAKKNIRKETK